MADTTDPSSFGVIYAPNTVDPPPPTLDILHTRRIKFVGLQWVDYTNPVRFFLTPTPHFQMILTSQRPGTGVGKFTLGLIFLTLALGFSSNGEYLLVPDLTSLRVAPYAQHHAVVMCYLQEKFPSPEHGRVVPIDPRTLLKRVIDEAAEKAGVSFLVGIEITVLEEIADALQEAGHEVQMVHAESAPGQLMPSDSMKWSPGLSPSGLHTRDDIRYSEKTWASGNPSTSHSFR
ncbi:hypothetical protein NLI96_g1519 [Meripilus lineatus]|uniref:Glutamine synthetase n=1 Tax=Meripilus lineatus TaxID=2056292 RepID=A0AAD5VAM0_9APHY|nr:hypothetical protein NLI96_g1519 [Physisporinus lineatus]